MTGTGPTPLSYLRLPLPLRSGDCVRADAATLFTDFGVFGFERSLAAFDATFFGVCSFFAIDYPGRIINIWLLLKYPERQAATSFFPADERREPSRPGRCA